MVIRSCRVQWWQLKTSETRQEPKRRPEHPTPSAMRLLQRASSHVTTRSNNSATWHDCIWTGRKPIGIQGRKPGCDTNRAQPFGIWSGTKTRLPTMCLCASRAPSVLPIQTTSRLKGWGGMSERMRDPNERTGRTSEQPESTSGSRGASATDRGGISERTRERKERTGGSSERSYTTSGL